MGVEQKRLGQCLLWVGHNRPTPLGVFGVACKRNVGRVGCVSFAVLPSFSRFSWTVFCHFGGGGVGVGMGRGGGGWCTNYVTPHSCEIPRHFKSGQYRKGLANVSCGLATTAPLFVSAVSQTGVVLIRLVAYRLHRGGYDWCPPLHWRKGLGQRPLWMSQDRPHPCWCLWRRTHAQY